jgi:hypothetical protein
LRAATVRRPACDGARSSEPSLGSLDESTAVSREWTGNGYGCGRRIDSEARHWRGNPGECEGPYYKNRGMTVALTPDQYARKVADELRSAHNSKDQAAVRPIFAKADSALATGKYDANDQRVFWSSVRKYFLESGLLLERQAGSALAALMRAIEAELAARMSKQ